MNTNVQEEPGQISIVFEYLLKKSGSNVQKVSSDCDIPASTLYNIQRRQKSCKADLRTLKKLADYFGEDISIFLGLSGYERPLKLTPKEKNLVESYRKLTDAAQSRIEGALEDATGNVKNLRKRG